MGLSAPRSALIPTFISSFYTTNSTAVSGRSERNCRFYPRDDPRTLCPITATTQPIPRVVRSRGLIESAELPCWPIGQFSLIAAAVCPRRRRVSDSPALGEGSREPLSQL